MRPCFLCRAASSCAGFAASSAQLRKTQCGLALYGLLRFIHLLRSMTKNFVSADMFSEKTPLTLQRTFFRRLSERKLKKDKEKCAPVFLENRSAFYLWVCDFGEQQAQPVYVHTTVFAC